MKMTNQAFNKPSVCIRYTMVFPQLTKGKKNLNNIADVLLLSSPSGSFGVLPSSLVILLAWHASSLVSLLYSHIYHLSLLTLSC